MATHLTVVAFALRRESKPFLKRLAQARVVPGPFPAAAGRLGGLPVLALESGVGPTRAEAAADWLGERLGGDLSSAGLLISAGFCGGLDPSLKVGDVVTDRVVTVFRLVASAEEKRRLAAAGSAAVDMESSVWCDWCRRHAIPFRTVRAVSDTADATLSPKLVRLLAGGRARPLAVAAALARSPALLPELLRLSRDTRAAADRLAGALADAVTGWA